MVLVKLQKSLTSVIMAVSSQNANHNTDLNVALNEIDELLSTFSTDYDPIAMNSLSERGFKIGDRIEVSHSDVGWHHASIIKIYQHPTNNHDIRIEYKYENGRIRNANEWAGLTIKICNGHY